MKSRVISRHLLGGVFERVNRSEKQGYDVSSMFAGAIVKPAGIDDTI